MNSLIGRAVNNAYAANDSISEQEKEIISFAASDILRDLVSYVRFLELNEEAALNGTNLTEEDLNTFHELSKRVESYKKIPSIKFTFEPATHDIITPTGVLLYKMYDGMKCNLTIEDEKKFLQWIYANN